MADETTVEIWFYGPEAKITHKINGRKAIKQLSKDTPFTRWFLESLSKNGPELTMECMKYWTRKLEASRIKK